MKRELTKYEQPEWRMTKKRRKEIAKEIDKLTEYVEKTSEDKYTLVMLKEIRNTFYED